MRERMKEEAAKRMRMLGLKEDEIEAFLDSGAVRMDLSGLRYDTDYEDQVAARKEKN